MRFIESILLKDGEYHNLHLHQERFDRTFSRFMPEVKSQELSKILPNLDVKGTYKVRVVYRADQEEADYDIEYAEYTPRIIQNLAVVKSEPFDYSFKFEDRSHINKLVNESGADDIIMEVNGHMTDSSYANVVFWNGSNWLTPDTPLLRGVRRTQLLQEGRIQTATIKKSELPSFEKVSLINAMLDLGTLEIAIKNIRF